MPCPFNHSITFLHRLAFHGAIVQLAHGSRHRCTATSPYPASIVAAIARRTWDDSTPDEIGAGSPAGPGTESHKRGRGRCLDVDHVDRRRKHGNHATDSQGRGVHRRLRLRRGSDSAESCSVTSPSRLEVMWHNQQHAHELDGVRPQGPEMGSARPQPEVVRQHGSCTRWSGAAWCSTSGTSMPTTRGSTRPRPARYPGGVSRRCSPRSSGTSWSTRRR